MFRDTSFDWADDPIDDLPSPVALEKKESKQSKSTEGNSTNRVGEHRITHFTHSGIRYPQVNFSHPFIITFL